MQVAGPTLTRTVTLDKRRSKSQSSCLWGYFKRKNYDFSFLWAQSEHRAWRVLGVKYVLLTSGQQCTKRTTCINSGDLFRDDCWYVYSLIFISTVLCSAFIFALGRKKKKRDIKEEAKKMPKIEGANMSLLCKCNLERAWLPHLLWLHRMRCTSPATCSTLTNNLIGEFPHSSVSPCEKPF